MGREIKRVAANFDWPVKEIWKGYLNPYYKHRKECPFCDGSGHNPETKKIADEWYSFEDHSERWCDNITQDEVQALVDHNRLMDFTHTWSKEDGWKKKDPPYIPTAEEVNEWNKHGFGHDAINRWVCVETRAKRLGVWGDCAYCSGEGELWETPELKKLYDEWEQEEPPAGDYYQLWETTSEGSPCSPPFETPEELAQYLVDNNVSSFGHQTESYDTWLAFIKGPGWAMSGVMSSKGMESGVKAVVDNRKGK